MSNTLLELHRKQDEFKKDALILLKNNLKVLGDSEDNKKARELFTIVEELQSISDRLGEQYERLTDNKEVVGLDMTFTYIGGGKHDKTVYRVISIGDMKYKGDEWVKSVTYQNINNGKTFTSDIETFVTKFIPSTEEEFISYRDGLPSLPSRIYDGW